MCQKKKKKKKKNPAKLLDRFGEFFLKIESLAISNFQLQSNYQLSNKLVTIVGKMGFSVDKYILTVGASLLKSCII